jgi:hypothetical protein
MAWGRGILVLFKGGGGLGQGLSKCVYLLKISLKTSKLDAIHVQSQIGAIL